MTTREGSTGRTSRRALWSVAALAVIAAVISCSELPGGPMGPGGGNGANGGGSGASDGGGGFDGGLTASNACGLMNARKCEYLQRCGLIDQGENAARDCASILVTTECGPSLWPARVREGTLRFYSTIARACAESYPQARCEDFDALPDLCTQFVTPGSALNGPCYGGNFRECQSGVCRGLSCPRTCRVPGTVGEDCIENSECATDAGLYCAPGGTTSSGTCSSYANLGASCSAFTLCAEGLYCAGDGKCQALRKNGESCEDGSCEKTNWCAIGADGGGVCTWRSVGGTNCTDDRQCQEGSICVLESGKCGSKGPLVRDTSCGSGQLCANGLACVGLTSMALGMCTDPLNEGEVCTGRTDCKDHLACVAADGGSELFCAPRRPNGSPCATDRDCLLYSACRSGSCTRLPRLGEPCVAPNDCVYGSCTQGTDGGRTCTGLLGPNAQCTFDAECNSNRCAAGSCLAACLP